jgi:hypothetical protein
MNAIGSKTITMENYMETSVNSISINGIEYVPKSSIPQSALMRDGMKYQIVRTQSAGVFAGYVESVKGQVVVMRNARRLWYWQGAASLSQMAVTGTSKPELCQFPCVVDRVELLQAIELLDCTEAAKTSIESVKIWNK